MKKVIFVVFFAALLILNLCSQDSEKELMKKIDQNISQKNYEQTLQLVEKGVKKFGETEGLLEAKFYTFMDLNKFDDALAVAEAGIKKFGERQNLLSQKYQALLLLGNYSEALEVALKMEKISKEKSYWDCLDIITAYAKLGNKEKACEWLDEAVNRGFIDYQSLYGGYYKTLNNEERFKKIIEKIKNKIGIGKQAKDFTIELLSGDTFSLSKQKGKIILINFWTTWSYPCRAEISSLKEYYTEYKEKGFEIIGISLDHSKEKLEKYINKESVKWKISFSSKGWMDEVRELYGVESIPSLWLVDRKGTLRYFGLREEKLRKAIEELISE